MDLCVELQRQCVYWNVYWRAPDAHGVTLSVEQALELLRKALGVEVEIVLPSQDQDILDRARRYDSLCGK